MFRSTLVTALICLIALMLIPVRAKAQGAAISDEEKIRAAANTYVSAPDTKVTVKMKDGRTYKGRIVRTDPDDFTLNDPAAGRSIRLAYAEVRSIKKQGMSKAAKTAIWVGVGAGIGALVIFGRRPRPLGTICPLGCGL